MSRFFFTADCHFNDADVILHSNRKPFYRNGIDNIKDTYLWVSDSKARTCCKKMDSVLMDNWNNIVSKNDIVYHLGDFMFSKGKSPKVYEDKLNGTIIHISGNHDKNNKVKGLIEACIMELGNLLVFVQHCPPSTIPENCDLVLCGHVHNNWKFTILDNIPIINVGVDVWNYTPINLETIIKARRDILKGKYDIMEVNYYERR